MGTPGLSTAHTRICRRETGTQRTRGLALQLHCIKSD